jgi:phosphoenolpyruvate carboxykinase (ATP)
VDNLGLFNPAQGAESFGFRNLKRVFWNMEAPALYEQSLQRRESQLVQGGALLAETGIHTGRSPKDKFVVRDATTEDTVWWENNGAITREHFDTLLADFLQHAEGKELFAQDLHGGADPAYRVRARVFTEFAWHSLFIRNLLIRPEPGELKHYAPDLTIIDLPSFKADPARHGGRSETIIACDFTRKIVLIGGTSYAGEMKKSVFTYLNYALPPQNVMPMHCSANVGSRGDVAVFFGLSGTGKTTLSADPNRTLLGDDEHGWSPTSVFNFEGGCYAKTIRLSREAEPEIFATTERFGTVLENVIVDPITRVPNFDDASKTENTRCAYPLDFIPNASSTGRAGIPKNIVMLTCDAFGVLPPIAKLTPAEAMYHFLSGYTAKVAGTEKGVKDPEATFSTCFGAPFMPRHPSVYGNLLREPHRQAFGGLLARQYRLDRRQGRRRPAHADPGHAPPPRRGARGLALPGRFPPRSLFRLRGADLGPRRRAAYPLPGEDLAGQSRLRGDREAAGPDVRRQLQALRGPRGRGRPRRRAADVHRGLVIATAHGRKKRGGRRKTLRPLLDVMEHGLPGCS